MPGDTEDEWMVEVDRLTLAEAADLLRDYERSFEEADEEGAYTDAISETVATLCEALQSQETDR